MSLAVRLMRILMAAVIVLGAATGVRANVEDCGPLANHFGPFDFRTAPAESRQLVERYHFTPRVETLSGGQSAGTPGGDIAYTLHVFPNHHRALASLIRLARHDSTTKPRGMRYSVACYFDRAERFAPNDAVVKSLHGIYLMQTGRNQDAVGKMKEALELAGDNANIHYNLGLAYFALKDYDKALASAHKAYRLGFQLPGLRNKLVKVGKWQDQLPVTKPDAKPAQETAPAPGSTAKE